MPNDAEVLKLLREIRDLLTGTSSMASARTPRRTKGATGKGARTRQRRTGAEGESALDTLLAARTDAEKWHAIWERGKALDKWLAVLGVAEAEVAPQTALSAPEIAQLLVDRFRLGGVHAPNVNRDLKTATKYVGRRKRGTGFEYWLTRAGLTYISGRAQELSSSPATDTGGRRERTARRSAKRPTRKAARPAAAPRASPKSKPARGRLGPKAMLEELISSGFFKSGKTISDIQAHLEQRRGHRYKATELSPTLVRLLRDNKLDREQNADGTYEYTSN